jgi:MYXO-CTERM domain-containing protein
MGTITFLTGAEADTFVITTVLTASDDILALSGAIISGDTTFNSATLTVPEAGSAASSLAAGLTMAGLYWAGRRRKSRN